MKRKKYLVSLLMAVAIVSFSACSFGNDDEPEQPGTESKILIVYFSWGGTTQRMAQQIATLTGGDLFRIEPANSYPTDYTACTEVALAERDSDARPAIMGTVENMEAYDTVFIGCPVWWHTAPMIISTFAKIYRFKGENRYSLLHILRLLS